ncbi:MAG: arginine repressor [Ammonifex sp.]|nr:MAG: arginine repressor [Ammonifex sp.]
MIKLTRHNQILQIISDRVVKSQRDLVKALSESGLKVTQATVSRDIRELGLIKVSSKKGIRYVTPESRVKNVREDDRLRRLVRNAVTQLEDSQNLVVVKTLPGAAQGVASAIDQANWPGVIGTVAGDDTILVVVKSSVKATAVRQRLNRLIFGEKG